MKLTGPGTDWRHIKTCGTAGVRVERKVRPMPNRTALENSVIEWVKDNCDPDEVFDIKDLREFVEMDSLPSEVFSTGDLEEWATENGFVKVDEASA